VGSVNIAMQGRQSLITDGYDLRQLHRGNVAACRLPRISPLERKRMNYFSRRNISLSSPDVSDTIGN